MPIHFERLSSSTHYKFEDFIFKEYHTRHLYIIRSLFEILSLILSSLNDKKNSNLTLFSNVIVYRRHSDRTHIYNVCTVIHYYNGVKST